MTVFRGPFIYVKMKVGTVAYFIAILKLVFSARSHYKILLQIANVLFSEHFYCHLLLVPCVVLEQTWSSIPMHVPYFTCIPLIVQDVYIPSEIFIFVRRHKRNGWD